MGAKWEMVEETAGEQFLLLRRTTDGKMTVVEYSREHGQVYSAMPGDMPEGSGRWYARFSDAGIDYVASGYSPSYARRIFRELKADIEYDHRLLAEAVA